MLRPAIIRIVDGSAKHPWWVVALALALSALSAFYAERHFAIKTDINELISPDLPWSRRVREYLKAFPQREILVVVEAPTPELVARAANRLQLALEADRKLFPAVRQPQGDPFFARNGLLYLPVDEVSRATAWLTRADDLIDTLASDPSLRGALDALSLGIMACSAKNRLDDLLDANNGRRDSRSRSRRSPRFVFWRLLANDRPAVRAICGSSSKSGRNSILGRSSPAAPRPTRYAKRGSLGLAADDRARVRLTGLIPMDDDEFASVKQNAGLNAAVSLLACLAILWLALGSARIIVASPSASRSDWRCGGLGLFLVGALNLISVGFFVLFVGLGVDFGIQFCVLIAPSATNPTSCMRPCPRGDKGRRSFGARRRGDRGRVPLLPADRLSGLVGLGQIAGSGMIIAFLTSITVLPALLAVLKPAGEAQSVGFAGLALVDRFLERHRVAVVVVTSSRVFSARRC